MQYHVISINEMFTFVNEILISVYHLYQHHVGHQGFGKLQVQADIIVSRLQCSGSQSGSKPFAESWPSNTECVNAAIVTG